MKELAEQKGNEITPLMEQQKKTKEVSPDFSDNILRELSPQNLRNLYERAQRDLQEFRAAFFLDRELTPDILSAGQLLDLDPTTGDTGTKEHPLRSVCAELLYIYKVTPREAMDYQQFLVKRLDDIEYVIDEHFELIKDALRDILRERVKREFKKKMSNQLGIR